MLRPSHKLFGLLLAVAIASALVAQPASGDFDAKGNQIRTGPLLGGTQYAGDNKQPDAYFFYTADSADITITLARTVITPERGTCANSEIALGTPSIVDDASKAVAAAQSTTSGATTYIFHSPTDDRPAPWTLARRYSVFIPQSVCGGLYSYTLQVEPATALTATAPLTRGDIVRCTDRQEIVARDRSDVKRWQRIVNKHKPKVIKHGRSNKFYLADSKRALKRDLRHQKKFCTPLVLEVLANDPYYAKNG